MVLKSSTVASFFLPSALAQNFPGCHEFLHVAWRQQRPTGQMTSGMSLLVGPPHRKQGHEVGAVDCGRSIRKTVSVLAHLIDRSLAHQEPSPCYALAMYSFPSNVYPGRLHGDKLVIHRRSDEEDRSMLVGNARGVPKAIRQVNVVNGH